MSGGGDDIIKPLLGFNGITKFHDVPSRAAAREVGFAIVDFITIVARDSEPRAATRVVRDGFSSMVCHRVHIARQVRGMRLLVARAEPCKAVRRHERLGLGPWYF